MDNADREDERGRTGMMNGEDEGGWMGRMRVMDGAD